MPAPETPPPSQSPWWLESLLWTLGIAAAIITAAYFNETAREVAMQGVAYFFTFFTTPFVLESCTFFIGLCIVIAINNRRIEREGDGWVEMEIHVPDEGDELPAVQQAADKASEV